MNNRTSTSTFLLLQFSSIRGLQILNFFVFLVLYLIALAGNLIIILAIAVDHRLHTPMYFFLLNLAMLDLGAISVTVPKSIAISAMNDTSISFAGCVAQVFFCFFFLSSDFIVLIIMAHDRNVAICNPLQYERIMHKRACLHMVAIGWIVSLAYATLHTCGTFAITFCSNIVDQYYCEIPQLLKLSCSDIYLAEAGLLVLSCAVGLGCFIFIIRTYVQIFATVLRIPSVHGQKKAFSTCIPHLTVVSLFMFSALFAYAKPVTNTSSNLDIAFAMIYATVPPMLNPFIYSMRNKEIKNALCKLLDVVLSSKAMLRCILQE
ncbi:olfactory receptor 14A16-like [Pogona vitticeps]|nr:olfactory receptor 14A16-like [Pogona vitticeps]